MPAAGIDFPEEEGFHKVMKVDVIHFVVFFVLRSG